MKKILICTILIILGLNIKAQTLYVQPVGNVEQVAFPIADKPKVTFDNKIMKIQTTNTSKDFLIDEVQNLSFTQKPVSIIEVKDEGDKIFVYPNPVKDLLEVNVQIPIQGLTYRIFDMSGKQLKAASVHSENIQISMQHFSNGVYFLLIDRNGQEIKSFKIIKQ